MGDTKIMSRDYIRFSFRKNSGPKRSDNKPSVSAEVPKQVEELKMMTHGYIIMVRIYQPTYQLNPRKRFNVEQVEKILKRILDTELEEVEYSEKVAPELCVTLAETIRNAVKEENYDRYRLIVCVTISQRRQQSLHISHAFLWDHERDAFAARTFENPHLHACAVVYGVYFD